MKAVRVRRLVALTTAALFAAALSPMAAFATAGDISTYAGTGVLGFSGDGGPAEAAAISAPHGIAVDRSGNVYIVSGYDSRARKIDATTGFISTIAGTGSGYGGYSGDGGPAIDADLYDPLGIAVDDAGNVFIADAVNDRIRRIDASGIITTIAGTGVSGYSGDGGPATSAELAFPNAVAVDSNGDVYIADTLNERVRKVTVKSGAISTIAGTGATGFTGDDGPAAAATLSNPLGVAVDPAGNVYIADTFNQRMRVVTAATGVISTIAGIGSTMYSGLLNNPCAVSVDEAGTVYIADAGNNEVLKLVKADPTSTASIAGNFNSGFSGDGGPGNLAEIRGPAGVAVDTKGNVYIADSGNDRIRRVSGPDLPPPDVPEAPATVLLTIAGLAFIAVTARRSSRRLDQTRQVRC